MKLGDATLAAWLELEPNSKAVIVPRIHERVAIPDLQVSCFAASMRLLHTKVEKV